MTAYSGFGHLIRHLVCRDVDQVGCPNDRPRYFGLARLGSAVPGQCASLIRVIVDSI